MTSTSTSSSPQTIAPEDWTNFELSTDELLRLKKAGVADEVLEAMQTAGSYSPVQPTQGGARTERVNQDSPKMPNEPGIYWVGKGGLAQLEPTVYSKQKASGMWKTALTYGIAKTKTKAVVAGRQANMRLSDPAPSFIFCFRQGRDQTALLGYWPGATSANEFILVRMTVSKNSREVQTGEFGAYGASTGVSDDQVRQFRFEKLDAGLYRVWPVSDLEPGEYCFFYGGAVGFLKVFDFSISSNGAL